mgnify:CR=1 FL=1
MKSLTKIVSFCTAGVLAVGMTGLYLQKAMQVNPMFQLKIHRLLQLKRLGLRQHICSIKIM